MSVSMCPHCGFNFEADKPLVFGQWRLTWRSCERDGQPVDLTPTEAGVLYTVARARGGLVSADAILNRVSESENANLVAVYMHRLRAKFGDDLPIETVRGLGYRWRFEP